MQASPRVEPLSYQMSN